jgi:hypothetical protein
MNQGLKRLAGLPDSLPGLSSTSPVTSSATAPSINDRLQTGRDQGDWKAGSPSSCAAWQK